VPGVVGVWASTSLRKNPMIFDKKRRIDVKRKKRKEKKGKN